MAYYQLGLVFKKGDPVPGMFEFLPKAQPGVWEGVLDTAGGFIKDIFQARPTPAPRPAPRQVVVRTGIDPKTIAELKAASRKLAQRTQRMTADVMDPYQQAAWTEHYMRQYAPRARQPAQAGMFGLGEQDWLLPVAVVGVALFAMMGR